MIVGARQGKMTGLRRLIAASMARQLDTFLLPGPEIARAHGLDIHAAGIPLVASPRHASVLLVVGAIPPALRETAAVIYAQMMRPRALFVLGTDELSPLPPADVAAKLSQHDLIQGLQKLRTAFAQGAFHPDIVDFDAAVLQIRIEYTCPMHPEIIRDEPGSCPKCGMTLMPREAQANAEHSHTDQQNTITKLELQTTQNHDHMPHTGMDQDAAAEYTCPMHPEVVQNGPGKCPKCGMNLEPRKDNVEPTHDHHAMSHDAAAEYICPMHPEVVQNEPGKCPKCSMNLELRKDNVEPTHDHHTMSHDAAAEYICPMHPEVVQNEPGKCPKCGMNLEPRKDNAETAHDHHAMAHDAVEEYTCPMHPEVVQTGPGSCPKCGMFLLPLETRNSPHDEHAAMDHGDMDHGDMDHGDMDHGDSTFMSMIDVTKDLPRSSDDLPMDWIDAPFGPFFPGLPSGLLLTLTLDGDTVAGSQTRSLIDNTDLLQHSPMDAASYVVHLSGIDPLTPVAYRLLACQALENAAGIDVQNDTARARIGALERERIASHLNWLALFAQQTGFDWLMQRAASLQLEVQHAQLKQMVAMKPALQSLLKRLQRTPLLKSRTVGIGQLTPDAGLQAQGPVARASGISDDARSTDKRFTSLGFTAAKRTGGDAFARLHIRLDEILHSLTLIEAAGAIELPVPGNVVDQSASGESMLETPRGLARLQLTLEKGQVTTTQLETPSTPHLKLVAPLTEQQALGDALLIVNSLDLSPWEVQP